MSTETKHTPGPWEISKIGNPYDEFAVYAESDSGRDICVTVRGEANARLIAAAPDLLLTLETIEAATEGIESPLAKEINRAARAAIAKTEGR